MIILPFLLHHANRSDHIADDPYRSVFYAIKDRILERHGTEDGYEIQHIPGKKCRSCNGTGYHTKYSWYPPYSAYDWLDCWHCVAGWYKLPKWICLMRYRFGAYSFHRPLKREECVKNPFVKEDIGWDVSERPVIKGYIEHTETKFSMWALLVLFWLYDRTTCKQYTTEVRQEWHWMWRRFKAKLHWSAWLVARPRLRIRRYWDDDFQHEVSYDDF